MEKIFNIAFLVGLSAIFFSRVFYVSFHFSRHFLNPLVFFVFPYFPGLSLAGGFLGGLCMILYFVRRRKMPLGKITDMYLLAFLASLPAGFLGLALLEGKQKLQMAHFGIAGFYFLLFILFMKFLLPRMMAGKLRDGEASLLFIFCFSGMGIVENLLIKKNILENFLTGETILFSFFLCATLILSLLKITVGKKHNSLRR